MVRGTVWSAIERLSLVPVLVTLGVLVVLFVAYTLAGFFLVPRLVASYVPRQAGGYFAETTVLDAAGASVGQASAGWTADPAAEEFKSLRPNRGLMEVIAKQTGGELVPAAKLDDFARALPSKQVPITENWTTPFWHQPLVFIFALACFAAEWGIRRMKGLV